MAGLREADGERAAMAMIRLTVLAAAGLLLGACEAGDRPAAEPKLASESICLASGNFQRCQFEHYLAGGYPIQSGRGPSR